MLALFLLLALLLVLVGHAFRLLRWEQFIRIYERPPRGQMLRGMAGGYALNVPSGRCLPRGLHRPQDEERHRLCAGDSHHGSVP